MMKQRLVVAVVALPALVAFVGFNLLIPSTARAQTTDECGQGTTIASLVVCVEHCVANGFINNQGVANSLTSELNAAQAAQNKGQNGTAINLLGAFIHEVLAQAGKHILQPHAQHMVTQAQGVIQTLENG